MWWRRWSKRATAESSSRGPVSVTSTGRSSLLSKDAIAAGVHVVMTVQTLWGYAQMYVYDTGRDLLEIGVVPLDNMLPETALMKLGWVLGHTDEHEEVMTMMRHSSTTRSPRENPTTATSFFRVDYPKLRNSSAVTGSRPGDYQLE